MLLVLVRNFLFDLIQKFVCLLIRKWALCPFSLLKTVVHISVFRLSTLTSTFLSKVCCNLVFSTEGVCLVTR